MYLVLLVRLDVTLMILMMVNIDSSESLICLSL